MINPILAVDTWQFGGEIDEGVLIQKNVRVIAIRLNQVDGGHYIDTNFHNQWNQAVHMYRIVYFVYSPYKSGTENFNWLVQNLPAGVKGVLVDTEIVRAGYPPAEYARQFADFLQLLKARLPYIVYTGEWFLPNLAYWPTDCGYWWAQYPLALYPAGQEHWTWEKLRDVLVPYLGPFNAAKVPGTLIMWQFTGDRLILPGCEKAMDVNAWMGTWVQLEAFAVVPDVAPPPPADEIVGSATLWPGCTYEKHVAHLTRGDITYHLLQLVNSTGTFMVTPKLGSRDYVPNLVKRFGASFGINGDGFVGTTPQGFSASNGTIYNLSTSEETLYIAKDNKFSISKPASVWNALSFPNRLIWAGTVDVDKPASDIDPRTAFGYTQDMTKSVWLLVDGHETYNAYRTGMSHWECAAILKALGCYYGFMFDGGGSTTGAQDANGDGNVAIVNEPCGEDPVVKQADGYYRLSTDPAVFDAKLRRVANALLFIKSGDVIPPPPPPGGSMEFQVITPHRPRSEPSVSTNDTGANVPAGIKFTSDAAHMQVDAKTASHPMMVQVLSGTYVGKWLIAGFYNGAEMCRDITPKPPSPWPSYYILEDPSRPAGDQRMGYRKDETIPT